MFANNNKKILQALRRFVSLRYVVVKLVVGIFRFVAKGGEVDFMINKSCGSNNKKNKFKCCRCYLLLM